MRPSNARHRPQNFRLDAEFPAGFATGPRWRKVEFDPSAAPLGPERICLQTVQLGAAKKYLERRLRRYASTDSQNGRTFLRDSIWQRPNIEQLTRDLKVK